MNDLMAVYRYVEQIRSKIVDSYLTSCQSLSQFADVDVKFRSTLNLIDASSNSLLDIIVRMILPEIEMLLQKAVRAQSTLAQEANVDGLLQNAMSCVTAVNANLEAEAFEAVLCSLWANMITLLKQVIWRLRTRCRVDTRAYSASCLGLSTVIQLLPNSSRQRATAAFLRLPWRPTFQRGCESSSRCYGISTVQETFEDI